MSTAPVFAALLCLAFFSAQALDYPATYPFENEDQVPPLLLPSTPSWTFKEDDPGGYQYTYSEQYVITEADFAEDEGYSAFCWVENFGSVVMVLTWNYPARIARESWNCTGRGFYGASDFTGKVNAMTICTPGECCVGEGFAGLIEKFQDDQMEWHDWFNNMVSVSQCETSDVNESLYCMFTNGYGQVMCYDQVLSPTERKFHYMCYDYIYNFLINCKLAPIQGYDNGQKMETPQYYSKISPIMDVAMGSLQFNPDRVCKPYSYFAPSVSSSASATTSTTSNAVGSFTFFAIIAIFIVAM